MVKSDMAITQNVWIHYLDITLCLIILNSSPCASLHAEEENNLSAVLLLIFVFEDLACMYTN